MPRVILGTTPLGSLISESRGSALALLELVGFAFFAAGVADRIAGPVAPWCLLAAALLGFGLRAVDLEASALFIPGGAYGAARHAFGARAAKVAGAAVLAELLLFSALTASAAGHAAAALLVALPGLSAASQQITLDDASMALAVCLIGAAWWGVRQGRSLSTSLVTRTVAVGIGLLVIVVIVGAASLASRRRSPRARWGRAAPSSSSSSSGGLRAGLPATPCRPAWRRPSEAAPRRSAYSARWARACSPPAPRKRSAVCRRTFRNRAFRT